jgi:hypothetical protein
MRLISILFLLFFCLSCTAIEPDSLQIMFWNVENLFYPEDDTMSKDDEFTPTGARAWGWSRYYSKINRIWKAIVAAGNPEPPAIIAVAEVENKKVLLDLFIYSPMAKYGYEILHQDSKDHRGIDVALIYDPERVQPEFDSLINPRLEEIGGSPTRDILFARFNFNSCNFYLFVNHWPSKYGGAGITEKFRLKTAEVLKENISTILEADKEAAIICVGDFNDQEESESLQFLANKPELLITRPEGGGVPGSYKYQGNWQSIDHVIISKSLYTGNSKLNFESTRIFAPGFLLESDDRYGGMKPFRTWIGYRYQEGFSDHLPVIIRLSFSNSVP